MTARLPITVAPAPHETVTSYVARLAALHGMPFAELWPHVSQLRKDAATARARVVDAELLATVTGRSVDHLRRTLFELRQPEPDWWSLRFEPQHGCPRCDARHPGGTVQHVFPHYRYVCVLHRVWIGPPDLLGLPLPNLDGLPEVVAAQRAHLRLLHRLGPAATFDAVLTAFLICGHLWSRLPEDNTSAWHHWHRRLNLLIPPNTESNTFSASRLFAATYPEAVKLAALIGSLHWRRLAAGTPDQQRRFTTEVARRINASDYRPRVTNDALAHWMDADCWQPPSLPARSYNTRADFGGSTPRKVPSSSHERHKKSALWFSRGRPSGKVGSVMVSHRHLQPVLIRDWAPDYEFYVGHLSESRSTSVFQAKAAAAHPNTNETLHELLNEEYIRPEPLVSDYLATATRPVPWHAAQQRLLTRPRPPRSAASPLTPSPTTSEQLRRPQFGSRWRPRDESSARRQLQPEGAMGTRLTGPREGASRRLVDQGLATLAGRLVALVSGSCWPILGCRPHRMRSPIQSASSGIGPARPTPTTSGRRPVRR